MSDQPQADRPQYRDGTPVPDTLDQSTREFSRGLDQQAGSKHAEPAEPVPTAASVSPATAALAGGSTHTLTGDNLGGSTGVTVGGTAATAVDVNSETELTFVAPANVAGAHAIVVQNPAGNSAGNLSITYA